MFKNLLQETLTVGLMAVIFIVALKMVAAKTNLPGVKEVAAAV